METHQYNIHVDPRGRLVLPAVVRQQVGIEQGGTLILTIQDDGLLRLIHPKEAARGSRGLFQQLTGNNKHSRQLTEELIAERRLAAKHE